MRESAGILPLFVACTKVWSRRWCELDGMAAIFIGRVRSRRSTKREKCETYPSSAATKVDRWCPRPY